MPSTRYNCEMIRRRVGNYTLEQILNVLDEIQTIVYEQDTMQTTYINPSTGMPPYLVTQNNIHQYDCPANCRRVKAVFAESPPSIDSRSLPRPWSKNYYFNGRGFYQVGVNTRDAIPDNGQLATVEFPFNPGSTTTKYYLEYYIQATPLTDINIQLTLPQHVHWRMRKAVIAMLRSEEYGDDGSDEVIIERVCRQIRNQLNRGQQARIGRTPIQEEARVYPADSFGYSR